MHSPTLSEIFPAKKPLIAVIHLDALPGAPRYAGVPEQIYAMAVAEAQLFAAHGVDGLIVENFRDIPFYPDRVPPETVAAMAAVTREIVTAVDIPVGVNVLRNDAAAAIGIAAATGADFIRVNVHAGAAVTDQGLVQGRAWETLRKRAALRAPVAIVADVGVKHAAPLADIGLAEEARDVAHRGMADGLIVSGSGTGHATSVADLRTVKEAADLPVWIGSGITPENLPDYIGLADGFIVGSTFKAGGKADGAVEAEQVRAFVDRFRALRAQHV